MLVLANPHGALVLLEWDVIFGAMLGDRCILVPFDPAMQKFDVFEAFLKDGKMIRYKGGAPVAAQNTTISAICALELMNERARRIRILTRKTGKTYAEDAEAFAEALQMALEVCKTVINRPRLVVCENPYATVPLSEEFGTGPFDERFGVRNGRLVRVFAGTELQALEAEERNAGIGR